MNIYVCVKQVPDTETKIKINSDGSGIDTSAIKWVMNPYDEFAVEESLKLKKELGAEKIYIVSLGPVKRVQETIRIGLAMGADEGLTIDCEDVLDPTQTAKALAEAIKKTGNIGVVLTGKLAIDDNCSSVPQQVSEFLEIPHTMGATKVEATGTALTVEREAEGGAKEIFEMNTPCLIAANKGLNNPRYPSLPGIMKAKKKPITVMSLADVGVNTADNNFKFSDYQLPPEKPPAKLLEGEVTAQVTDLVKNLKEEAKVL